MPHAIVVGAGLSGLMAATTLVGADRGWTVTVLDKSVGPGGRMATRRIGDASFDHGAQFFTVRSGEFSDLVDRWTRTGAPIRVWGHGLASVRHIDDGPGAADTGGDGYPRYVVRSGMNALAKHIATGLDVRANRHVHAVVVDDGRWRVEVDGQVGEDLAPDRPQGNGSTADALVLTAPVPQSLALLDAGGAHLATDDRVLLDDMAYDPCLAVMIELDRSVELPDPGGVQVAEGPIRILSDNQAKGTSRAPGLTVHLRGDISRERYDDAAETVVADTLAHLVGWLGDAQVTGWQLKRWRYSQPVSLRDRRALRANVHGAPVVFAGDAFGEPKVEGAVRSGIAAGRDLLEL